MRRERRSELVGAAAGAADPATHTLQSLPAPGDNISVAVYNFADQTGQFKPTEGVQTLSRAVTQGATSILVKALQESGRGRWFTVIERERLDNLLRERAVIREMRASYLGETKLNRQALPRCFSRASFWKAASSDMTPTPSRVVSARGSWASAAAPNIARIR